MTPEQIELVKSTWASVEQISDTAAELFYGKLFELDPKLKELFKGDMTEQGKKLMQMIGVAVANLHQLGEVLVPVQELGKRHVGYNVKDEDYDTVAQALLWTLEQGLKDAWNEDVKAAWTETYVTLANVMKEAAAGV
jgi:hemoglobin-like flavoprotein